MNRFREAFELILILGIVVACHVTKKGEQALLPAFDKQGHRGCRGLMPENTVPAMLKAIDLGVTTLEMDAVITKDRQVILSHEPFFNHDITTGPDGKYFEAGQERNFNIYKMTFAETRQYDVGLKENPRFPRQQKMKANKPLLREVIDDVEAYVKLKGTRDIFYNIETKTQPLTDNTFHPAPEEFVDILMKVINQKKIGDRVIIQSFDFRTLKIIHQKHPQIKTAVLIEDYDKRSLDTQLGELGFIPTIYSPAYNLVTKELVEKCHKQYIRVIPWTVNDKDAIQKLKDLGVDGIITDYPDLLSNK
jgi:glycerophosphoryl diester phosphodiesterase